MKNKIVVSIIVMLLISTTTLPVLGMINDNKDYKNYCLIYDEEYLDQQQTESILGYSACYQRLKAQSFVPTLESLSRVELLISINGNPEYVSIFIKKELDFNSDILAHATIYKDDVINDGPWKSFDFEDIEVIPGETYYILYHQGQHGDFSNSFLWWAGSNNPYKSGDAYYSNDYGNTWTMMDSDPTYPDLDFCFRTYGMVDNTQPEKPSTPTWDVGGKPGTLYTYSTSTIDNDNDPLYYLWDWGDDTDSGWLGPYISNAIVEESHSWANEGTYDIKVKCKDPYVESEWSDPLTVNMPKYHNVFNSEVLDQSNDISNWFLVVGKMLENQFHAQSFTPTIPILSRIEVKLHSWNTTYPLSIQIRKTNDDEILASKTEIIKFDDGISGWYSFNFEDIDVIVNESYSILINSKQPFPGAMYGWYFNDMNTYGPGSAWNVYNDQWNVNDEDDFCFRSYGIIDNDPPDKPDTPKGPNSGTPGTLLSYITITNDNENDNIYYFWEWGDGTDSGWLGPYNSGDSCEVEHSWPSRGDYDIKVKAKDIWDIESEWSDPLTVSMPKTIKLDLYEIIHKYPILINIFEKLLNYIKIDTKPIDDTEYWGLLIAVGEYLNNPNQDRPSMLVEVENIYQSLISSENWEASHIRKITGQNANLKNILDGFKWLNQMEGENDISLVYITTHGGFLDTDYPPVDEADGKDEILVPYEGFDDLSKFLWDDEINFFLNLLDSKAICLIVDSCYSGGFNDKLHQNLDSNILINNLWRDDFISELSGIGRVILMSSSEDQVSYGSTFSRYISIGLDGESDSNQDSICTAEETFYYVQPIIDNMGMQHPTIVDTYDGELPLVIFE
ncbi:hypothetical protein ACFL1L_04045 [Thermoplasmatota archaeon]